MAKIKKTFGVTISDIIEIEFSDDDDIETKVIQKIMQHINKVGTLKYLREKVVSVEPICED